jgi:hypothetical protein
MSTTNITPEKIAQSYVEIINIKKNKILYYINIFRFLEF